VGARIALATYDGAPDLAPDDQTILPELGAEGIDGEPVVWSNDSVAWDSFDAVLIRSCWDYHLHIAEFRDWLARLEASGVRVWNDPTIVRWNADKRYLIDLAARGVATIPTTAVLAGSGRKVQEIVTANGWAAFVVKPAVSASGYETHLFNGPLDDADRATIARVASVRDVLVQPFVEEVRRDGELSFTFIDGEYSHAALKRATPGEFRVQTEYGGSVEPTDPPNSLVDEAACALDGFPEVPLYARVDGVVRDGSFLLMELELIEPNLFLASAPGGARRLARAVAARL
jgi:glutathione synthase/RimK-type ligase-like ATP-grasp enzyme